MLSQPVLSRRKAGILHSIVREYIETGQPVPSKSISERRGGSLSPATIRNVMAELCDEGYLSQPHTSAGRVPTEKAIQTFVRELTVRRPSPGELERLKRHFEGVETLEAGLGRSSHVLTEITHNVGIAAAIPASSQVLDHIELVSLTERRVLAVVVTTDRIVRNRVVALDEDVPPEELASIRNYVNHHFRGWTLSDARLELERRLRLQSAYYDALSKRLTQFYSLGLLDIDLDPEIHLQGTSYLVALDLRLTREKMGELLRALEEKKRIIELLDRFLELPGGELCVRIGLEDVHPTMKELALIGLNVTTAGGVAATIAVLGSMRMHYEKVMATVAHVGKTLRSLPS